MAQKKVAEKNPPAKPQGKAKTPAPAPRLQVVVSDQTPTPGPPCKSSLDVFGIVGRELNQEDREVFMVLHLNGKSCLLAKEVVSVGSQDTAIVHPREVFKGAVLNGSASIVCVHNHPSGDPTPSQADREITARLRGAGEMLGVELRDHVIIGKGAGPRYYSFVDSGDMPSVVPVVREESHKEVPAGDDNNLLRIQSCETEDGDDIETAMDFMIQRLRLIEDVFFAPRDGHERMARLDEDAFRGLGLLMMDATTGAILLRKALFGDKQSTDDLPARYPTRTAAAKDKVIVHPAAPKEAPDVSCDLAMIAERLEFVLQAGFEAEGGVKALGDGAIAGLISTLFSIKWDAEKVLEKLYPKS